MNDLFRPSLPLLSGLLAFAATAALLATDAFGAISISFDLASPALFTLSARNDVEPDHTGLFFLLSVILAAVGAFNIFPLRTALPRLLYSSLLSISVAKTLYEWAFPVHFHSRNFNHSSDGFFALPWIYCMTTATLAVSSVMHASSKGKKIGQWIFATFSCLPVVAVAVAIIQGTLRGSLLSSITWIACASSAGIAVCVRLLEITRDLLSSSAAGGTRTPLSKADLMYSTSTSALAALLGLFWVVVASWCSPRANSDVNVPAFSLLLLCTREGVLVSGTHPWALVAVTCAAWWTLSALYAVFLRGRPELERFHSDTALGPFHDADVSIWSPNWSLANSLLAVAFTLLPLPAVSWAFLRRKDQSEDFMFVFTTLGALSVMGGQLWSIRFLGVLSVMYGAWRCRDMGLWQSKSNNAI